MQRRSITPTQAMQHFTNSDLSELTEFRHARTLMSVLHSPHAVPQIPSEFLWHAEPQHVANSPEVSNLRRLGLGHTSSTHAVCSKAIVGKFLHDRYQTCSHAVTLSGKGTGRARRQALSHKQSGQQVSGLPGQAIVSPWHGRWPRRLNPRPEELDLITL